MFSSKNRTGFGSRNLCNLPRFRFSSLISSLVLVLVREPVLLLLLSADYMILSVVNNKKLKLLKIVLEF